MMKKLHRHSSFCILAALAVGGAACNRNAQEAPASGAASSSPVLAEVAGVQITQDDFEAEVAYRVEQRRPIPEKAVLLGEMIDRRALLHRAREAGLESESGIRRELDNLLIAKLRQRELDDKLRSATVSDSELKAEYESRIGEFTRPAKVRVSVLHLKAGAKASDEKRAEVRARIAEARAKALANPAPGGRGAAAQDRHHHLRGRPGQPCVSTGR